MPQPESVTQRLNFVLENHFFGSKAISGLLDGTGQNRWNGRMGDGGVFLKVYGALGRIGTDGWKKAAYF